MSAPQDRKKQQAREARLEIVAELYKKGYSIRKIQAEVMKRLDLSSYSTRTVHNDVAKLLKEWRENRLEDMDDAIQLELERINDTVRELWEQWERSKINFQKKAKKKKGAPITKSSVGSDGKMKEDVSIQTTYLEETETDVLMMGDVSYISEIRSQLQERRKLLGLYAAEKKDISGDFSFLGFLMDSGVIEDIPDA